MNGFKHLLATAALITAAASTGLAANSNADAATAKTLKVQTHCPVMGGEIDSTSYTDIQGQRVYHCCPACTTKLINNPDLYFKKAAAAGILYENIQTTDPVSGEKLAEKKIFTDYEGRRLYFTSEANMAKFTAAPAGYLKKMEVRTAGGTDHNSHTR